MYHQRTSKGSLISTLAGGLCCMLALSLVGCGDPQIAPTNLHLTATLRTAVSARNEEWLEKNAALIAERHAAGEMSDDEQRALQAIVEQARAGDWEDAERAIVRLQQSQRPTADQIERVRATRTP